MKITTKYIRLFIGYSNEFDCYRAEIGVGTKCRASDGLLRRPIEATVSIGRKWPRRRFFTKPHFAWRINDLQTQI